MLLIALSSLALFSCVCGENPAVQLALTDKGLQAVRHFAAGVIQEKLEQVELPKVEGRIMGIHYTLSGMKITQYDFPEPEVHFSPFVSGLVLSLSGLNVALTGDWATHLGAIWVFQWLVNIFQDHIRSRIQKEICPCVEDAIQSLEQHLQAINVSVEVNPVMSLELPLSAPPDVHDDSINFGLKGEFYSLESHTDPPFVAPPFSLPIQTEYMLSMGVSEYSANSASFAYYISGHLQALVNDSMIPSFSPIRLNTRSMGRFIPQLQQKFPDLLMVLQVYARQTPLFSFEPGFVKLDLLSAIKAFVVQSNSTLTPVFKLHADSALSGKMWLDGKKVLSTLKMDNFSLSLASSEIGPFKTAALEGLAKMGVSKALDMINKKLAQGFDLPHTTNAQLVNSVLSLEKGFMAFFSDAKFHSTL
ncbi:bactericidal permeability-increasing protein isoform X2 [Eucyclogobius newberryi]|uniref:bactericidal permeability-increasing protein isoform X2 n=1 Tax=Eucyclogobius newberryi TaxID=166745 RepID=UPI003B5A7B70